VSSGGGRADQFNICYIEAEQEEAKLIFYNRFGHNPERISCTCCGPDYIIYEDEEYDENDIEEGAVVIPASEIKPEEREGDLPLEGYIWH